MSASPSSVVPSRFPPRGSGVITPQTAYRQPPMMNHSDPTGVPEAESDGDQAEGADGLVAAATRVFLAHQRALTAYILAIVHDHHVAEDVRQEVWLVVAKRWDEYGDLPDPWPTMRAIARRQALAALRRLRPQRMVPGDAALDALAEAITEVDGEHDARRSALDRCLEALPAEWRQLLDLRYRDGLAVTALAERLRRRADTVSMHLHRVRAKLLDCIEGRLRQEPGA